MSRHSVSSYMGSLWMQIVYDIQFENRLSHLPGINVRHVAHSSPAIELISQTVLLRMALIAPDHGLVAKHRAIILPMLVWEIISDSASFT